MCYNDYVINVKRGGYIFPAIIKQGNIKMEEEKTMQENEITFDDGLTNRSDAWLIVSEMGRQHKESDERNDKKYEKLASITKWLVICYAVTVAAVLIGVAYYIYNTESNVYTYSVDSEGEGFASFFGNDGVVNYGEGTSD